MTQHGFSSFDPSLFRFLTQLKRNNQREWFQQHKSEYETAVLEPALAFIRCLEPLLKKISSHYAPSAQRVGGSLLRINRDIRFSKDKTPYKTNVGVFVRHELSSKSVTAPGFYVHLELDECFLGVGIWQPDSTTLGKIRTAIDTEPAAWKRARDNKRFRAEFDLVGESLKSPPRGYAKDHPLLEDLKRKDFTGMCRIDRDEVLQPDFPQTTAARFKASAPYMRFLCSAIGVPF